MVPRKLQRERALYRRVVAALGHAEPSSLLRELEHKRTRRFGAAELVERWRGAEGRGQGARNLYLHVPFCKSICSFCNYKRLRVSSGEALDEFVAFIEAEARLFAPAFAGLPFETLYVGGGTPSVLAADQLARVLDALHTAFEFLPNAEKTFEFDPMVMTADRHQVLASFGFRRFSFGIQSVDVAVNRLHNRGAQGKGHLERQFRLLAEHGALRHNVDFLLGLAGTTPAQMLAEIEEVMTAHGPREISVYYVQPTHEYLASHFDGEPARYRAFLARFEDEIPAGLAAIAARAGYRQLVGGTHALLFVKQGPGVVVESPYSYCDVPSQAHRPLFLLGLGDSARSRIFADLGYRAEHDHADRSPDLPRYLGAPQSLGDEIFSYLALTLRDGDAVPRALFERTFGRGAAELLAAPLAKLAALGVAHADDDAIHFVPQRREERLADLLFFLPQERRGDLAFAASAVALPTQPIDEAEVRAAVAPLAPGAPLVGGWELAAVRAAGLSLRRAEPPAEVLLKLFKPPGSRASFRRTGRYDVQYQVVAGSAEGAELEAPVDAVVDALRANEA
jgi:coproporphyrinogen III oxidase-like Fe-S oxidoreductase